MGISNININSKSYDWKDIDIHFSVINYSPLEVYDISYTVDREIDYSYSRTGFPVGRKYGRFNSVASIEMSFDEINKILAIVPSFFSGVIPIDIRITYNIGKDKSYTDVIYGCKPIIENTAASQGEIGLSSVINLNPVWIKYGRELF